MRVLALDVGDRRVGIAISDPIGMLARPLTVVKRSGRDYQRIADLAKEHGVELIVAGYPRNMDGSEGEQARKVEAYLAGLEEHIDVPIELWDEQLSTFEAQRLMIEAGRRARERRERIDAAAAAVILQDYLDTGKGRESP
ncbi:MAG: Holliday junction resolvase RuvX [Anaerolineae bacterium]|nr:Holliday junction resolvase RuvX [Anaerolineae bacterium]